VTLSILARNGKSRDLLIFFDLGEVDRELDSYANETDEEEEGSEVEAGIDGGAVKEPPSDDEVEAAPEGVGESGGEAFAGRFGEGRGKGLAAEAGAEMGDGVAEEEAGGEMAKPGEDEHEQVYNSALK
jgi:hypothetical protein